MRFKRVLATGLAMAMVAGTFAGCGQGKKSASTDSGKTGGKESITLWTYPIGNWGKSETVDKLIANFNQKYPDIKVTVQYLDYKTGDDQVNTAIEGKKAPDLIMEGPERLVANWGSKGLMVDLADMFAGDAAKDFYPNVTAACKSADGKYYEYPLCMVAHCMAINKTKFEKANALQYLDLENHTWTTENYLKAVKALADSGQGADVTAVYCSGQGGDQGTRALVNNLYGGRFTNTEHTRYTVNSEANIKALQALKDTKGVKFDPSIAGGDEITLFRNGTLAISNCWNASQQNDSKNGEAGKTNNGDEIIPMQFPSNDGKAELCGGIWGFGVFNNGSQSKIDAAKKFIDFMANDQTQTKQSVLESGFFPTHKNLGDVYAGQANEKVMKMFTDKFMPSMGDYYQVVPGWATARTEWWNMLQRVGTGGNIANEVKTFDTNANAAAAKK